MTNGKRVSLLGPETKPGLAWPGQLLAAGFRERACHCDSKEWSQGDTAVLRQRLRILATRLKAPSRVKRGVYASLTTSLCLSTIAAA